MWVSALLSCGAGSQRSFDIVMCDYWIEKMKDGSGGGNNLMENIKFVDEKGKRKRRTWG